MDVNARNELESIKKELNSIIRELESISYGVRNDFTGIGSDRCADSINVALDKYYSIRRKLNNIDLAGNLNSGGGSW